MMIMIMMILKMQGIIRPNRTQAETNDQEGEQQGDKVGHNLFCDTDQNQFEINKKKNLNMANIKN